MGFCVLINHPSHASLLIVACVVDYFVNDKCIAIFRYSLHSQVSNNVLAEFKRHIFNEK